MDSANRCREQSADCLRLMQSAQGEIEARILKDDIAQSWVRLANQIERYQQLRSSEPDRASPNVNQGVLEPVTIKLLAAGTAHDRSWPLRREFFPTFPHSVVTDHPGLRWNFRMFSRLGGPWGRAISP
jgi:hypothetical protein